MNQSPDITEISGVLFNLGYTKSLSQGRKEGFNKPVAKGGFKYGKRKFKII